MTASAIVFTDLDGTLLDHETYEFDPARSALRRLAAAGIPVVLNTSKTTAEVRLWQQRLSIRAPFAVENGSAIIEPVAKANASADETSRTHVLGTTIAAIRACLRTLELKRRFEFTAWSEMTIEAIADHAALPIPDAELASKREYSEPIIWRDTPVALVAFEQALTPHGLSLLRGGRYVHVLGRTNKAHAVSMVKALMNRAESNPPITIALGDSANDLDMLSAVDYPVVIRNPHTADIALESAETIYIERTGPHGWHDAIGQLFDAGILND